MVEKKYDWNSGAELGEHSKRKHKILRDYFYKYLLIRCQTPNQEKFRLAIVDGFAGGGTYKCGSPGSPIIFIEELRNAITTINIKRADQGMPKIAFECLLFLNDDDETAIEVLKERVKSELLLTEDIAPSLHINVEFRSSNFDSIYFEIKEFLLRGKYRNVIFNLDPCGHTHVKISTISDIMQSNPNVELFFTFFISTQIAFLKKFNSDHLSRQLAHLSISESDFNQLLEPLSDKEWLGKAEKLIFHLFSNLAAYVSPFTINNPDGWRYWLIHFARSYRARQVYNDILHENSTYQAHYGRAGLNMLAYDPKDETGALYLFDQIGRDMASRQLEEDVPRLVSEFGDTISVLQFYESIYNLTPAHTDDIHQAIITNPDTGVYTIHGGERLKTNTISVNDTIKLKPQTSFSFPMFPNRNR